jgi:hypothetical protein
VYVRSSEIAIKRIKIRVLEKETRENVSRFSPSRLYERTFRSQMDVLRGISHAKST